MAAIILKAGILVDPEYGSMRKRDIWIENGNVSKIGIAQSLSHVTDKWEVIDCEGLLVVSGLIDMHVHGRTPGQEYKENLSTLSMAALAGGFTSVVCMANTDPVIDNIDRLHKLMIRIEQEGLVNIYQVAALSENLEGFKMTDLASLRDIGAIAFSDDGKGVQNPEMLQFAMARCSHTCRPLLLFHCQDDCISTYDKRSEYYHVYYILKLSERFGCPVHIQHVSCAESVQLIREVKAKGVKVTCETAPHYISLTSRDFKRIGADAKMNPPLRSEKDRLAVIQGLVDGTIDVIATDHAPHSAEEKEFLDVAPFGIIGLETAVPVVFSFLKRYLTVPQIIALMTINPARILGLEQKGLIKEGRPADITIIDPNRRKVLEAEDLKSKSQNSPWLGKRMQTWPVMTIRNGKIMMRDEKIIL